MGATKQAMLEELDREEAKKTAKCRRCEERFNPEEMPGDLCEYCQHMTDKDD